jgi:hypothetical protein
MKLLIRVTGSRYSISKQRKKGFDGLNYSTNLTIEKGYVDYVERSY